MQKVNSFKEIQNGQIVLFFDTNSGKIRGFDKILDIKPNGDYEYKSQNQKIYNGNLNKLMSMYSAYVVSDQFLKYSDELFASSLLNWDYGYVFTDVLNKDNILAKTVWSLIVKKAKNNIEFRIKFMDLTEQYKIELQLMLFQETENHISDLAKKKINHELISLIESSI